ncbi:MAG: hypothetical protein KatS3mg055_3494 [Chloroflexus sp.]|uniref:hypothetical protein n=1 Tax=Chloroflexus sp. TaxID=1904827 RepID=UPI0021DC4DD6|nr:hypothetical protein [Chloroflexus sp.]GIV90976.1 MAG: hypothetical protein KatS3mg055_3494 [Chloroflexus sp.]
MWIAELLALLIYPGGLWAFGLGIGYRVLTTWQLPTNGQLRFATDRPGWMALTTLICVAGGLTGLPWPWHPSPHAFGWLGAWALLEVAAWLPLWPTLTAGTPRIVRAAMREAQISLLGRALLWGVAAIGFSNDNTLTGAALAGHGLMLVSGLLSLPAAINWGPFGPEPSLGPHGIVEGQSAKMAAAITFARDLVAAALITVVWQAGLPLASLPAWVAAIAIIAGSVVTILSLRWLQGRVPRFSVPVALRFTLGWAGSITLLAVIVLR